MGTLTPTQQSLFEARLSPEALAFMIAPAPESTWVAIEIIVEAERAFQGISILDPFAAHGVLLAQRLMDGRLEGLLLGWMGPRVFLRILPHVWGHYNRGGLLSLDHLGEHEASLSLWADFPTATFVAKIVPAFAAEALRRLGAEGIHVEYVAPRADEPAWRHRYSLNWKA